jgi:hypothetical protein
MFLARVYFTSLPYDIYNQANRCGNMAYAGIGLGLMEAQKLFWIANMGLVAIYFNKDLFILLAPLCCFIYILSIVKVHYLTNILLIKHT